MAKALAQYVHAVINGQWQHHAQHIHGDICAKSRTPEAGRHLTLRARRATCLDNCQKPYYIYMHVTFSIMEALQETQKAVAIVAASATTIGDLTVHYYMGSVVVLCCGDFCWKWTRFSVSAFSRPDYPGRTPKLCTRTSASSTLEPRVCFWILKPKSRNTGALYQETTGEPTP